MTTVAIVGRPNVGKSTLFNRLVGQRLALVHDLPGVTRDRREGEGRLGPLSFRVIDTAGLEEAGDDSLEARMRAQTERAVAEADVALFLIDARAGVTPLDSHFADWLRGQNTPVLLLANKSEGRAGEAGFYESYALGLGEPVAVSAEHGEGLGDLYDALAALLPEAVVGAESAPAAPEDDSPDLQLAIVGRPNVGKSTLINRLIGADRLLTGPEAGITRDAIAVPWAWGDRRLRLVDTAGLRRKARITDRLEKMSGSDSLRAVRFAQVVALVLDAGLGFEKQDLTIARHVVEEGRALVVVVNKWDAVEDRRAVLQGLRDRLETSLTQARGVPFITLSALTGKGLERLMPTVFTAYDRWNQRVSTGRLNRWLDGILAAHPPPMVRGRRLKIRYVTQVKSRPPTFALWVNMPDDLPESYQRHLVNGLRESFDLAGVPIRLLLRRGENPYADDGR